MCKHSHAFTYGWMGPGLTVIAGTYIGCHKENVSKADYTCYILQVDNYIDDIGNISSTACTDDNIASS